MSEQNQTTILGENLETNNPETQGIVQENPSSMTTQATEIDYLEKLVGEGKKYTSIEDAAKALAKKAAHADSFIETLKTEKRTLEEQLSSAKKIDDILSVLNQQDNIEQYTTTKTQVVEKREQQPDVRETVKQLLDEQAEIEKKNKELNLIKSNQEKAWDLLAKEFDGRDNAKLIVRNYINNDSTKANIINQMGSYQPEELVSFLKVKKDSLNFNPTVEPTTRTVSEFDETVSNLTWSKAKEIKKNNPKLFRSHKFQNAVHQAAAKDPNFLKK